MRAKPLDIGQDYLFLCAYGLGHSQGPYMAKSFVANTKKIHKTDQYLRFLCLYYLLGPKSFVFQSHGLTEIRKNALPSYK